MSKFFPFFDITRAQKNSPILAYQTLFVKPYINACYNLYMGRNYFSKHGGPYFINNGFSRHSENDNKPSNKKDIITFICGSGVILVILFIVNVVIIKSFN
jgi:hypothetical protein